VVSFRQVHFGVPVVDGFVVVGFDAAGDLIHVGNGYLPQISLSPAARLSPGEALASAESYLGSPFDEVRDAARLVIVRGGKEAPGVHLAWEVHGFASDPLGDWHLFVSAEDGRVVRSLNKLRTAGPACVPCNPASQPGCGLVFHHNPVDLLNNPGLRDTNNVDGAQQGCELANLVSPANLTGLWADTAITSGRVAPPYNYPRSVNQLGADEVTVYYHADRARRYLESLVFPTVMAFPITIDAHDTSIGDNSYYDPGLKELHFGTGGVDDGQDPDIVYHEYGHAIQDDQVPGFGSSLEGGAMGEGFGDYWAGALTDDSAATALGPGCVGSWDATSYNPFTGAFGSGCLRRLDNAWLYPRDLTFEVHNDGEIWSAALWALRGVLGGTSTDALVVKAHSFLSSVSGFIEGADALLSADVALNFGANEVMIHAAFAGRGIPRTGVPASSVGLIGTIPYACSSTHNYQNGEYKECAFTQPGASRIRAHFFRLNTEFNFDWVYVSDAAYNQVEQLSGTPFGATGSGYSATVSGDTIVVRFKADGSIRKYGFDVDSVEYAAGAGEVPDGAELPGTPLSIAPASGGDVTLTWGASCAAGDSDFAVYEGAIGAYASHASRFCTTGGVTSATFTPAAGSSYYLVVPNNGAAEGSYGRDGLGLERPPAALSCFPQEIAATCP